MSLVEKAMEIAVKAHSGQFRWDKVTPYITHPVIVSRSFVDHGYIATALLHDVIEDCGIKPEELSKQGISQDVVDAVVLLTRYDSVNYWDYIIGIIGNTMATSVKIADIKHNMETVKSPEKLRKYKIALFLLEKYRE